MRLIDADKFIEKCNEIMIEEKDNPACVSWAFAYDNVIYEIKGQPTVDAVFVIRCKDCKWYKEEKGKIGIGCCTCLKPAGDGQFICWSNWYCGDGQRKDG